MFISSLLSAQELQMEVTIDDTQYPLADKTIFEELKSSIEDFVNNRRWTEDEYEYLEKINCNLVLTVNSNSSQTVFDCQGLIQSSRPVYNSGYETGMVNFVDKNFDFTYAPGQPIEFNDNAYTSELSSLLAYYCYMILGMDYDSFSENGGKDFYQKALNVKNTHPNADGSDGWKRNGDPNNRHWFVEDAINPQFDPLHKGLYTYHRIALDQISTKQVESQKQILGVLKDLEKVFELNPSSVLISSFFLSKRTELVAVFKGAEPAIQDEVIPLLRKMDPANSEKYQTIKN